MSRKRMIRIRTEGAGYAAEGPDFYVWDPDRAEVERSVRELSRGNPGAATARQVVSLRMGAAQVGGGNSEALDW